MGFRLRSLLVIIFIFRVLDLIWDLATLPSHHPTVVGLTIFLFIMYTVFQVIGYYGASKRDSKYLFAYFVIQLIATGVNIFFWAVIIVAIGLFFLSTNNISSRNSYDSSGSYSSLRHLTKRMLFNEPEPSYTDEDPFIPEHHMRGIFVFLYFAWLIVHFALWLSSLVLAFKMYRLLRYGNYVVQQQVVMQPSLQVVDVPLEFRPYPDQIRQNV